jgi:hypothetical protein
MIANLLSTGWGSVVMVLVLSAAPTIARGTSATTAPVRPSGGRRPQRRRSSTPPKDLVSVLISPTAGDRPLPSMGKSACTQSASSANDTAGPDLRFAGSGGTPSRSAAAAAAARWPWRAKTDDEPLSRSLREDAQSGSSSTAGVAGPNGFGRRGSRMNEPVGGSPGKTSESQPSPRKRLKRRRRRPSRLQPVLTARNGTGASRATRELLVTTALPTNALDGKESTNAGEPESRSDPARR